MTQPQFWPGTNVRKSTGNSFTSWKEPGRSIFLAGFDFRPTKSGTTIGKTTTAVVEKFRQEHGRCKGTMTGLSKVADRAQENRWNDMAKRKA